MYAQGAISRGGGIPLPERRGSAGGSCRPPRQVGRKRGARHRPRQAPPRLRREDSCHVKTVRGSDAWTFPRLKPPATPASGFFLAKRQLRRRRRRFFRTVVVGGSGRRILPASRRAADSGRQLATATSRQRPSGPISPNDARQRTGIRRAQTDNGCETVQGDPRPVR
jgi:hypothetical protein